MSQRLRPGGQTFFGGFLQKSDPLFGKVMMRFATLSTSYDSYDSAAQNLWMRVQASTRASVEVA
jgi:hypothetical protein